nr:probable xyloglucan 6-xylosyltransferase 5 [Tanacetum cinerariifolium]
LLGGYPEVEWIWCMDSDALFTDMVFRLSLAKHKDHNMVIHGYLDLLFNEKSWIALNTVKIWLFLPRIDGFVKASWSLFIMNGLLPVSLVALDQDELPSSAGLDFQTRLDGGRMYLGHLEANVSVTKLTTGRLVNGSSCDGIDMVIKNLDLESKIDAMMRDFL